VIPVVIFTPNPLNLGVVFATHIFLSKLLTARGLKFPSRDAYLYAGPGSDAPDKTPLNVAHVVPPSLTIGLVVGLGASRR
jgi:hypothetical protein